MWSKHQYNGGAISILVEFPGFWFPTGRVCKWHKFSCCLVISNVMLLWSVFPMASPNLDPAEPDVSFYVATNHRKEENKTNVQKIWQVTA